MGRFTLRIPKTLHSELEILAKDEGISLNQFIIYALTQKVTASKLSIEESDLSSKQATFISNIQPVSPEEVSEQAIAFDAYLSELGPEATNTEVDAYLSERQEVSPESDLDPQAVLRLKERLAKIERVSQAV